MFNANPKSGVATMHVDDSSRFKSMTVVLAPCAELLIKCGQSVTMLDMAHSKHKWYKGQHCGLVGTDGDNRITLIAWGVCPVENTANYCTFFDDVIAWEDGKLKNWMNSPDHVQLSDRFKGIPHAQRVKLPNMRSKNCMKHLIGNMRAAKDVANTVSGVFQHSHHPSFSLTTLYPPLKAFQAHNPQMHFDSNRSQYIARSLYMYLSFA
jgi:hypothetical protein